MTTITEFQVRKGDLAETRSISRDVPTLKDGEVLAKIDRFAFTANNVTYGVVGEKIGYWKFFPVAEDGWGVIPVWGFADIVESNCADVPVGERLYGYWPMATHLVMTPGKVKDTRLADAAEHRASLPPVYNSYARTTHEDWYDEKMDDERMVLFPLYATSYCIYDFLKDNDWYGAKQIILPSASSKTAIGTAYALQGDDCPASIVGLTSARNRTNVGALGLYNSVVTYDEIQNIDATQTSVIVDMSGNGAVLGALHKHLGDNMRYTSNVGVTHYEANDMGPDFIRERSQLFFAPGHIQKRTSEWGPGEFEKRAAAFWHEASVKSRSWLNIKTETGTDAIDSVYRDVLEGKTPANVGLAVRL